MVKAINVFIVAVTWVLDRPQAIELSPAAMGTNRLLLLKNSAWMFGGQLNAKEGLRLKIRNVRYDIDQSTQGDTGCILALQKKFYLLAPTQHQEI